MTDISSVIRFYVRRNSRLRERGEPVHSIRGFFSRYDSNDDVLKMLVDSGKAKWITVNGAHVCINVNTNTIIGGPEALVGKNASDISTGAEESHSAENPETLRKNREYRGKLTGEQIAKRQKNLKLSETGKNASCGGFRVTRYRDYLQQHVQAHGYEPELSGLTPDEYEAKAEEFLRQPCGKNILGGLVSEMIDGVMVTAVIRYDRKTGLFAKGIPGAYIMTFMQPKYYRDTPNGRQKNPDWKENGYQYYLQQMGLA